MLTEPLNLMDLIAAAVFGGAMVSLFLVRGYSPPRDDE